MSHFKNLSSWAIFFYDLILVGASWVLAYYVRFNFDHVRWKSALLVLPWILLVHAVVFKFYGIDRQVWRFVSLIEIMNVVKSISLSLLLVLVLLFFNNQLLHIPRSVFVLYPTFLLILLAGSRALVRYWIVRRRILGKKELQKRTLIIGGGQGADLFLRDAEQLVNEPYKLLGILDDRPSLKGKKIRGVKVIGTLAQIEVLVERLRIDLAIIAIPSLKGEKMQHLVEACKNTHTDLRILPSLSDLISGRASAVEIKEVSLEDLLGRDPIAFDHGLMASFLDNKIIMVTGAGGSIGSELCRQILMLSNPDKMILIDHSEFNLYQIESELLKSQCPIIGCLASVTDKKMMVNLMQTHKPQVIFHTAAYKHVPLLEHQPKQAVINNIVGTRIMAKLADEYHVEEFVFVSTDKAVNPTNVMGASKRIAEIYCQNFNAYSKTQYVTVRFGNVLGSAGSVVPLFKQQLKEGGPLTVTHPEVERFFMTIPEASQLILQAGSMGKGGEIFVLDMGESIKIKDLAEQIITLSGKTPHKDVDIEFIGLRPGEKLYEELFYEKEPLTKIDQTKIFIANKRSVDFEWFDQELKKLFEQNDVQTLRQIIKVLVPEFVG